MNLAIVIAEHGRPAPNVSQYRQCWTEAKRLLESQNAARLRRGRRDQALESGGTNEMKEYLNILGHEVRDRVTGFTGVATTVGFDLYGCVQVIVSQPGLTDKGETKPGQWFYHKRLVVTEAPLVMEQPTFEAVAGGYGKPVR